MFNSRLLKKDNRQGPVAQPGRASPWHGEGLGFKSPPVHF